MTKALTATELRSNVYRILDQILETGQPQEIDRKGSKILLVPVDQKRQRLKNRPKRTGLNCTIDELVETSWEKAWKPDP